MAGYTIVNLMELENRGKDEGPIVDQRMARAAIESEHIGVSRFQYAPGRRFAHGHAHREQEEVYLVLGGSGRIKVDDEWRELAQWDLIRVAPATFRGLEAGPDGLDVLAIGSDRPEGGDGISSDEAWWGD